MQKFIDNQEILNSAMDKQNVQLRGVSKSGTKQFLQYYIDNNKLSQLLPVQIILNSVFDRQTASICISNSNSQQQNEYVVLNNSGYIDNNLINLQFDPKNLSVVQDVTVLQKPNVQITIKDLDGSYKAVTLQQLQQLFSPKLQIYQ